jgi:mitochondrial import receptor subunit TOM40
MQGGVDGTGAVTMRLNQNWNRRHTTKIQGQVCLLPCSANGQLTKEAGRSMLQAEHDILGDHYSINLKTVNPGLLDGTGIHIGSIFHSISPRLSAGFETVAHCQTPGQYETATSYMAKLTSLPTASSLASAALTPVGQVPISMPFDSPWIATAQLQSTGNVQATYYQKLSDKVDVALDFQTLFQPTSMMGPAKRDAVATLGAKYDFRLATFRAQVDSTWKVGMLLEQRFTPAFAFLVGGEVDHKKVSYFEYLKDRLADQIEHFEVRRWNHD